MDTVKSTDNKPRIAWVDYIKMLACALVAVFHLLGSMEVASLMSAGTAYNVISQGVYTFHVPLFFICSGFLYQKYSHVNTIKAWGQHTAKKFIALGVPYFTFTIITLLLKNVFSDSVNNQATPMLKTLFITPIAPYWFLYALFFIFLITPCFKSAKGCGVLFAVSLIAKIAVSLLADNNIEIPYIIKLTAIYEFWFAAGMLLSFVKYDKIKLSVLYISAIIFTAAGDVLSILYYQTKNDNMIIQFITGVLFCIGLTALCIALCRNTGNKTADKISAYFMPIYVMHTICAAGARAALLHFGITSLALHIIIGLIASFALPALYYIIAQRFKPLMFFIYPLKALKKEK